MVVVDFLEFGALTVTVPVHLRRAWKLGVLAGPPADGLAEGCKDIQVEAPEAPRRPLGKEG